MVKNSNSVVGDLEEPTNLLTAEEVATLLRVSTKTVYNWAYRNFIPRIKFGRGLLRFRRSEIDAWLVSKSLATLFALFHLF